MIDDGRAVGSRTVTCMTDWMEQPKATTVTSRVLAWFSAGAPSAVAAKLAIAKYGHERVVVAYVDPGSEHWDTYASAHMPARQFQNAAIDDL